MSAKAPQESAALARHAPIVEALATFPGIRQAILFGSVATGAAGPESDLDIGVEAERPLTDEQRMRLIEALAVATGRPVDLIDLRAAGQPLLGEILKTGVRLFGDNEDYARLIFRNILDREDFLPYHNRILKERREAWLNR
ncbi:MAG TPA: nucleotidyltransferase domain-containing protein [Gammaproteobacteria bacterium]|nr:nucleotidyltransferase domain-containing protein [Gammaproteobacteria bacterium]